MIKMILAVSALAMSSSAIAQTPEPNWVEIRAKAESEIKAGMFDPDAAKIEWQGGWRWSYFKGATLSKKKPGWLGCAKVNGKNRYGGYTGVKTYFALVDAKGKMHTGDNAYFSSGCDDPNPTPLQAAFIDTQTGAGTTSVADELTKLAGLLEKGLITKEEFEAQKAKLLN